VLWALAATIAVLQPCRDALAASLPHPHGPRVASATHAHSHGAGGGPRHPAADTGAYASHATEALNRPLLAQKQPRYLTTRCLRI
jgi:hypothetical protein